jgi:small subunit ribosomal protein S16
VVVADAHSPRDGRFIEEVGRYNPCSTPTFVRFDLDKVDGWLKNGAQPTETVAKLLAKYREDAPTHASEATAAPAATKAAPVETAPDTEAVSADV